MKSFLQAFTEYHEMLTIAGTKPRIVWLKNKYIVTMYYSESTIKRLGGKIIYG